jgi:histone deacetylase complex regulatory component SIN3
MSLLKKERQAEEPTNQQIITYRRNAEDIIGQDDSLFRINWVRLVFTFPQVTINHDAFRIMV